MSGEVVAISSVYHHGMTHLPAKIREYLEVKDGDLVQYRQDYDGRIFISKASKLKPPRTSKGKYI